MSDLIKRMKEALLRSEDRGEPPRFIIGAETAINLIRDLGPLPEDQYLICGAIDLIELEKALNEWKSKNET